jgi:hypothetical protein
LLKLSVLVENNHRLYDPNAVVAANVGEVRGRGRPRSYSLDRLDKILANLAGGMSLNAACEYAGINYETLRRWQVRERDGEAEYRGLTARIDEARSSFVSAKFQRLNELAQNDGKLILRILSMLDPENFSERRKVEMSGSIKHDHSHRLELPNVPRQTDSDRAKLAIMLSRPSVPPGYFKENPNPHAAPGQDADTVDADWNEMDMTDDDQLDRS